MAARSISVAKFLISNTSSVTRRGISYAAVSHGLGQGSPGARPNMVKDISNKVESDNSWGPDPVTGFYRPVNRVADIGVVDLRSNAAQEQNQSKLSAGMLLHFQSFDGLQSCWACSSDC